MERPRASKISHLQSNTIPFSCMHMKAFTCERDKHMSCKQAPKHDVSSIHDNGYASACIHEDNGDIRMYKSHTHTPIIPHT
jgi:hypothetical protein